MKSSLPIQWHKWGYQKVKYIDLGILDFVLLGKEEEKNSRQVWNVDAYNADPGL